MLRAVAAAVLVLSFAGCLDPFCGHHFGDLTWKQGGVFDALKNTTVNGKYREVNYENINVSYIDCCAPDFADSHLYFRPNNTIQYLVARDSATGQSRLEGEVQGIFEDLHLPRPTFANSTLTWSC